MYNTQPIYVLAINQLLCSLYYNIQYIILTCRGTLVQSSKYRMEKYVNAWTNGQMLYIFEDYHIRQSFRGGKLSRLE